MASSSSWLRTWRLARTSLLRPHSSRAERRGTHPTWTGEYIPPHPLQHPAHWQVTQHGLSFISPEPLARATSRTIDTPWGLRQAILPEHWDGQRAVVVVAGAGVYAAGYPTLYAHLLQELGAAVVWQDLCGMGFASKGRRFGHIQSPNDLIDPVVHKLHTLDELLPERPKVHLLGFSLGGMVALRAAQQSAQHLTNLVAVAPFVRLAGRFGSPSIRALVALLSQSNRVGSRYIHREALYGDTYRSILREWYNPDYQRRKAEDPFMDDSIVPQSLRAIFQASRGLERVGGARDVPVTVFHSHSDRTCCYNASRRFAASWQRQGACLKFHTLDGIPHQVFHMKEPLWRQFAPRLLDALLWERPSQNNRENV